MKEKTLEDVFYEQDVRATEVAFEGQMHFGRWGERGGRWVAIWLGDDALVCRFWCCSDHHAPASYKYQSPNPKLTTPHPHPNPKPQTPQRPSTRT